MSAPLVVALSAAGALGAVGRFCLDGLVTTRLSRGFPWGILLVNVLGSLLLGILTGLVLLHHVDHGWALVLGTGLCGGFTTFSTASYAGVRLAQQDRPAAAALELLGTLLLCTVAAATGLALTGA